MTDKSTGCHGYQLQEHIPPEGTLSLGWEGPGVRLSQGSSEPLEVILEGAVFLSCSWLKHLAQGFIKQCPPT